MRRVSITLLGIGAGSFLWGIVAISCPIQAQALEPDFTTIAQSPTPVTYMTVIDDDHIVMQITEGEFRFHGWLERQNGAYFSGEDEQVRVMYDRDTKRIVVINKQTGDEYYNYFFSDVDEGAL